MQDLIQLAGRDPPEGTESPDQAIAELVAVRRRLDEEAENGVFDGQTARASAVFHDGIVYREPPRLTTA